MREQDSIDIEEKPPAAEADGLDEEKFFELDTLFTYLLVNNIAQKSDITNLFERLRSEGYLPEVNF